MALEQMEIVYRLLAATLLGAIVGFERELRRTAAGIRTLSIVCLGSAMFTLIALMASTGTDQNPGIITASIITGIGFLGAGSILRTTSDVKGLTTAASIWLVAAVGMAVGYGFYYEAFIVTILAVIVLAMVKLVEVEYFNKGQKRKLG